MKRTISTVTKCFLWLVITVALLSAAGLGYARSQGLQVLSVQTGSMRPAIRPGDAVLVRTHSATLSAGDIVSYRSIDNPRAIITHRIVAIDRKTGQVVAKGDRLRSPDPIIQSDRIIGKVERTIPLAGYGFDMLRNPVGLIMVVYLPGFVVVCFEVQRLMRYYDRRYYRLKAYPW